MIRLAKPAEADNLTRISFDSKGYWNYPSHYFEIWKDEYTITPDYIDQNDVFVCELVGQIIGYYSLVTLAEDIQVSQIIIEKGVWLEHMFVTPEHIGNGAGRKMFTHLTKHCKAQVINEIKILADPNSRGFYEKMGCQCIKEYPSTIKNRTTPLLILSLNHETKN